MPNTSPHLGIKEDASRLACLFGEINEELVYSLTGQILQLRATGDEPITVLIDSPGGSIDLRDCILRLFRQVDAIGGMKNCPIVTVVRNYAASAAATVLTLGDYAMAYPGSIIHYHGARISGQEITSESARHWADRLNNANEGFAAQLAIKLLRRNIFIYFSNKEKIKKSTKIGVEFVKNYAEFIQKNVSEKHKHLIKNSANLAESLEILGNGLLPKIQELYEKEAATDLEIRKFILNSIIEDYAASNKNTTFSRNELEQITDMFFKFVEYSTGAHNGALNSILENFADFLFDSLNDNDRAEYDKKKAAGDKDITQFLLEKTFHTASALWYYTLSLCQLLQKGENRLDAQDAYWLGLVDEVVGVQSLRSLRAAIIESQMPPTSSDPPTANI